MMQLPYRQIHLDFHTSEHIPEVGKLFNADEFVSTLKAAYVNWVNLFAKCHHGWSYYPTKAGTPHPNLLRSDLLGEMISACRGEGIRTGVYISVQWDERTARNHPEWRVKAPDTVPEQKGNNRPFWKPICLSNPGYIEYILSQIEEVIGLYDPDGLWMDILNLYDCSCENCVRAIIEKKLNPEKRENRLLQHRDHIMNYYRKVHRHALNLKPEIKLFHNSGHIYRGERDRYRYFTHLEVESLPTGGWGYDHFPVSVKYAARLNKDYIGMTGKFHTMWGEFGGYKTAEALEYECAHMAAYGAGCSIGDQLHPSGKIDRETYRRIAPAYKRIADLERFIRGSRPCSEIALLSAESHRRGKKMIFEERGNMSDDGAARMLMELHEQFDVIDWDDTFEEFRLLVLPDEITLDQAQTRKIENFLAGGRKIILSGSSGMDPEQSRFSLNLKAEYTGKMSEYSPDYILITESTDPDMAAAPFVMYEGAYMVKAAGAEVLAETRLPYFNRSPELFCSHQHAPYRMERNIFYDGVIRDGNIVYLSHPVFREYYKSGQPLVKYLFRYVLDTLLPDREVRVNMPSSGRVSFMKKDSSCLLHLLCVQPQLRGHDVLPQKGHLKIEIIEDIIPVYNITCAIRIPRKPVRIYSAVTGKEYPFKYENATVSFTVDEVYIHELVIIETDGKEARMK